MVELLFRELKSSFGLDKLRVSGPVIIETLLVVAALSLVVSRSILEQLRELERVAPGPAGEDSSEAPCSIPTERGSAVIRRHAEVIHLQLMVELGYDWPDLDAVLYRFARDPNPHRSRLREQVQSEAFPVALA